MTPTAKQQEMIAGRNATIVSQSMHDMQILAATSANNGLL